MLFNVSCKIVLKIMSRSTSWNSKENQGAKPIKSMMALAIQFGIVQQISLSWFTLQSLDCQKENKFASFSNIWKTGGIHLYSIEEKGWKALKGKFHISDIFWSLSPVLWLILKSLFVYNITAVFILRLQSRMDLGQCSFRLQEQHRRNLTIQKF